jgi:hypothetical protein
MLNGLHILLTYQCLSECDHCFLYCGPRAEGTFTLSTLRDAMDQAVEAGVEWLYLEGGEPFLHYPLMVEGARLARQRGFKVGIVTNGYWGGSDEDAEHWLRPLVEIGVDDLSISEDDFHAADPALSPARTARRAAERLGLPASSICIERPFATADSAHHQGDRHGEPVIGGDVVFRGRAAEKLVEGLPRRPYTEFTACTEEDLETPSRVHLDPFGNVFICQGLIIGNVGSKRLREIMDGYRPLDHPIVGPLLRGGPAELARIHGLPEGPDYVSACHLCYLVRWSLVGKLPEWIGPPQVYGHAAS